MAVGATAIWRVRPSGSNTNGGGYDPGISGAATDYSQQNAAQATGTHGTATGTTTFTDTVAANFTSAMVGNAIWIASGAGFTVGAYFVTAFGSSTSVTLDRSPGTGTVAVWAIGGGWADFWTNTTSSGPVVAQNTVYVLGSGTPSPAAYIYDYDATTAFTFAAFNSPAITLANDPATPGYKVPPDTTGGMPVIKFHVAGNLLTVSSGWMSIQGLWFVGTTTAAGNFAISVNSLGVTVFGCVMDQFSFDLGLARCISGFLQVIGCEVFSSAGGTGTGSAATCITSSSYLNIVGCNIHDCVGSGIIQSVGAMSVINTIVAKCAKDGISLQSLTGALVQNCTIDGNLGNGITLFGLYWCDILNNIISNHTTGGKSGVANTTAGPANLFDFNVYYNNTTDITNGTYGPHDSHGGSNPYLGQSTENYGLA